MKIPYEVMLELVLKYCNQSYKPRQVPKGLKCIVEEMCKYAETHDSNLTAETISGAIQNSYAGKDLFQVFSGMLAPYKRLKTL